MLLIFQILFSLFALFAVGGVIRKRKDGLLGPKGAIFWTIFWLVAAVAVWWPNSTTILANTFGIGRGTDLVLYISLMIIFYILFRLNVKIEGLNRGLTKMVRKGALEKKEL